MPQLSKVSEPLCKLTEKNVMFTWDGSQEEAFQAIKSMISSVPLLKYYDVASETTIQCDASRVWFGSTSAPRRTAGCISITLIEHCFTSVFLNTKGMLGDYFCLQSF